MSLEIVQEIITHKGDEQKSCPHPRLRFSLPVIQVQVMLIWSPLF
jgi:hypothetical protein